MKSFFHKPDPMQTVLQALLRAPGSTKPELCKITALPPSTMHHIMSALEAQNLVCPYGVAASTGGRRAARYQLNNKAGVLGAVNMQSNALEVGLYDLGGQCLFAKTQELSFCAVGPESYTAQIAAALHGALSSASCEAIPCVGVGVCVPGPVDFESGTLLQLSGAPIWQHFPLAHRLHETLHVPVTVDKDVYAGVEFLHHAGKTASNRCTVYLSISDGIRSAALIHGQVFRGTHSLSGEIGHLTVRRDGIPCNCGNTGCLELYCSDSGIVKQYNAQSGKHLHTLDEVLSLMAQGDSTVTMVLSQAMRYLVDTISSIIMHYDPDELIIACRWLNQQRNLFFHMLDTLYSKNMFTRKHAIDIRLPEDPLRPLDAAAFLAQKEWLLGHCDASL